MLGVFDEDIGVAVPIEDAGIGELEFGIGTGAALVLGDELGIGEFGVRIFVKRLEIGMRGRGIEKEIFLLHILAVVAFAAGETEEALLEDRVAAVPEREREAEPAFAIGYAEDAVLAPAIGAAAGVVVRKIIPAGTVGGVVFTDGGPLTFGEVRAPAFPVFRTGCVLLQALGLGAKGGRGQRTGCGRGRRFRGRGGRLAVHDDLNGCAKPVIAQQSRPGCMRCQRGKERRETRRTLPAFYCCGGKAPVLLFANEVGLRILAERGLADVDDRSRAPAMRGFGAGAGGGAV